MNFGYFGQHTSSMKKHYGYFLMPPSEQASGSGRCWKTFPEAQSWGFPRSRAKPGNPACFSYKIKHYLILGQQISIASMILQKVLKSKCSAVSFEHICLTKKFINLLMILKLIPITFLPRLTKIDRMMSVMPPS